ncbi:hypothetical protein CPB86DRAFT_817043 [Serendipita vermifera]|nr:hypothetical protein CPB86DRAFT_817043 [Serendipita vermifera]
MPQPNLQLGLEYWEQQEATIDGVLGGYGNGSLPRVDALSSRLFLLSLLPTLSTIESPLKPLEQSQHDRRTNFRALDVGAGVGRVTKDVLLHLFSSVVLLEPVQPLISVAVADSDNWKGIKNQEKSVSFIKRPLQQFDPSIYLSEDDLFAHVGAALDFTDVDQGFDVVWCQWCLGHLSDKQLVRFLKMAQRSLRENGIIVVKENCCPPAEDGEPDSVYDSDDSSLTRSHDAWLKLFQKARLTLVRQEIQRGFPAGLYEVRAYALR